MIDTNSTTWATEQQTLEILRVKLETVTESLKKAEHERNEYRKLYELVLLELERLRRHVFGKKSERVPEEQLSLQFLQIADTLKEFEKSEGNENSPASETNEPSPNANGGKTNSGNKKRTPHGRKPLPEHLPVERIELPPPLDVQSEPESYRKIDDDISETLEYRPGSMVRVQVVRPKFVRKGDDAAGVIASDLPTKPIEKGLAGPGMLAQIITQKYADHLPLHRLERIYQRHELKLSRSTMGDWIEQCANLAECVYDAMWQDAMTAHCIAFDATGVLVQAIRQCWHAHIWVFIADHDHVLYHYSRRHDGEAIQEVLGEYRGNILADAHPVYDILYKDELRIEFGCMSHARRYFFDSLSTDPQRGYHAIMTLKPLFKIEKEIKDEPPDVKKQVRQERSKPLVNDFFTWCDEQWPLVIEETPIYKALRYARNQREALSRFLDDGRIPMHNNFSELKLRHEKVGTKNWLFLGSEDGGKWNCVFNSLIASCALHKIEPWAYLRDLLTLLPDWPKNRVLELCPKFWNQTLQNSDAKQRLLDNPFWRISAGIK